MAANSSSRAPQSRPERRGGSHLVFVAFAGLLIALLLAFAMWLSYIAIYQLAERGNVTGEFAGVRHAHVYPGIFTALMLLALGTRYVLRDASWPRQSVVDLLLLLLSGFGAYVLGLHLLEREFTETSATIFVAAAPWVALLVGLYLCILGMLHLKGDRRRRTPASPKGEAPVEHDTSDVDFAKSESETQVIRRPAPSTVPLAELTSSAADPEPAATTAEPDTSTEVTTPATAGVPARARAGEPAPSVEAKAAEEAPAGKTGATDATGTAGTQSALQPGSADPSPGPPGAGAESGAAGPAPAEPDTVAAGETPGESGEEPETGGTEDRGDGREGEASAPAPRPAGELPELPKRTPGASDITKALSSSSQSPDRRDEPWFGAPSEERSGERVPLVEDGFVPDPTSDDPTSDEAHAGGTEPPAATAAGSPTAPTEPTPSMEIQRRSMVRRPRRTALPDFPEDPPSGRVRSRPVPPKE